jgi:hypothetical protein
MPQILTPEATASYPSLYVPRSAPGSSDLKYSIASVFPPGTDLSAMERAVLDAAEDKFGGKAAEMLKTGKLRSPFRRDAEEKGYPAGSVYINASSKHQVGVVDKYKDPKTGKARVIDDPSEIYPGCKVKLAINFYAYDVNGNRGVAAGLNAVQKVGEGERLDGRRKAEDIFVGEDLVEAPFVSGSGPGSMLD